MINLVIPIAYFISKNACLYEAGEQVPLLRDHVRQLVHLRLQEGNLLGSLDELVVVLEVKVIKHFYLLLTLRAKKARLYGPV